MTADGYEPWGRQGVHVHKKSLMEVSRNYSVTPLTEVHYPKNEEPWSVSEVFLQESRDPELDLAPVSHATPHRACAGTVRRYNARRGGAWRGWERKAKERRRRQRWGGSRDALRANEKRKYGDIAAKLLLYELLRE